MSQKQILCCLSIVGVISILIVIVLVIVQNGTDKQTVLTVFQTEMRMDETMKPTTSENTLQSDDTTKAGSTPNEGSMPNTGNTQKPFEIQVCSPSNRGHCECGDVSQGFQTYVFTNLESEVRCFTEYIPTTFEVDPIWPLPVLFLPDSYGKDKLGGYKMIGNKSLHNRLAARYGYIRIGISTPNGNWEFANDGLINDEFPMPCEKSTDMSYVTEIIAWLDLYPDWYDTTRLYAEGHHLDSVFSAYMAYCFHQKFRGVWQSGKGMGLKGMEPFLPGCRAQVLDSDWAKCHAQQKTCKKCIEEHPCSECQYWPIYPCYTPEKPMIHCLTEYTNDGATTNLQNPNNESTELYMYSKLLNEGHDARLLRFSPSADGTIGGHHKKIANHEYWIIGKIKSMLFTWKFLVDLFTLKDVLE